MRFVHWQDSCWRYFTKYFVTLASTMVQMEIFRIGCIENGDFLALGLSVFFAGLSTFFAAILQRQLLSVPGKLTSIKISDGDAGEGVMKLFG